VINTALFTKGPEGARDVQDEGRQALNYRQVCECILWSICYCTIKHHCFDCSLAGLVRLEYQATSSADMRLRTQTLFTIASRLKWLSNIFNICVVVVNQVSS